jgi:hypothetical protein
MSGLLLLGVAGVAGVPFEAATHPGFQALLFVTMRQEDRDTLLGFEGAVAKIPQVVQAQRLYGWPRRKAGMLVSHGNTC